MRADRSVRPAVVARLAEELFRSLPALVEAALVHSEQDFPDFQARLLQAGEDPEGVISGFSDILARSLANEEHELPLELALRAGLVAERLAAAGIGLETLVQVVQVICREAEVLLLDAAPTPSAALNAVLRLNEQAGALIMGTTRAYLEAATEEHLEQERALRALIGIARAVARSLEPAEVAEAALRETVAATAVDVGAIWLTEPGSDQLTFQTSVGLTAKELEATRALDPRHHPRTAEAIRTGLPGQSSKGKPSWSSLVVPLNGSRGLLGVMALASRRKRTFRADEIIFAGAVSDHIANSLDHALEHRLEAHTDYLTGLANRAEFESAGRRHLAASERSGRPLALLLMDLNGLKQINDGHGHHAGDEAIRAVGRALLQVVRTSDISARLGGDEFGVAMPEAGSAQAEEVVTRIRSCLDELNADSGYGFRIELSYGLAQWEKGMDFTRLYELADRRLYADKRRHQARSATKIGPSAPPPSSARVSSQGTPSR